MWYFHPRSQGFTFTRGLTFLRETAPWGQGWWYFVFTLLDYNFICLLYHFDCDNSNTSPSLRPYKHD